MAIRGTSAGGLTALGALIRADGFAGAAAWYGVTDLEALVADTHDFESRYVDSLVGPWPAAAAGYRARSPIHHPDRVSGAVLLLQGADDPVVPADQAERFAAQLGEHGVPCRLTVFAGESHGFRRADTIEASLDRRARLLPIAVRRARYAGTGRRVTGRTTGRLGRADRVEPGRPGGTLDRADRPPADAPVARAVAGGRRDGAVSGSAAPGPPAPQGLSPEWRDAFLYGCSAVFAGVTGLAVGISLYRQWGQMAFGPYAAGRRADGRGGWRTGQAGRRPAAPVTGPAPGGRRPAGGPGACAFLIVLFGATLVPLALEVIWRSEGNAALHVQPEVVVVEQAGARAAHGRDPYRVVDRDGHIVIHQRTEPTYELYYPYLPGMVIFGFSTRQQGRGPADRRPHPVPGLHRWWSPCSPSAGSDPRPTPGSGPSRS